MAPFFRPGATDGYGRYYLRPTAGSVRNAVVIPQIGRRWHELPSDFCGFGRDGYCYYNGVKCAKGDFGTGTLNHLSWGDVNPPLEGWSRYLRAWGGPNFGNVGTTMNSGMVVTPSGSTFSFYHTDLPWANGGWVTSAPRWMIGPGDWDVELSWTDLTHTGPTGEHSQSITLCAWAGDCSYTAASFNWVTADFNPPHKWVFALGNSIDNYPYGAVNNGVLPQVYSGKLRLVKSGNVFSYYYWEESTWKVGGAPQTITSGRMRYADYFYVGAIMHFIQYRGTGYFNRPDASCSNISLTINSGTVQHLAPWALQPAGDHRGPRQDFPEYPLFVAADNEIAIIDLDDPVLGQPVLWQRLIGSLNNQKLFDTLFGSVPQANLIFFDEGDLLIPYNPGAGYNAQIVASWPGNRAIRQGAFYNNDGFCWDRLVGSGNPYAHFRHTTVGLAYPNGTDDGKAERMAAWDSTLHEGYETISGTPLAGHLWTEGLYRYYAAAISGANVTRYHMEYVTEYPMAHWTSHDVGATTYAIKFSPLGHLVYVADATIYVAYKATWNAAWGSGVTGNVTFSNDLAWSSPGTRSETSQYAFGISSDGVYVARDEGVYYRGWSDGSWTLLYGSVGSGATYEVLPAFTKINCVDVSLLPFGSDVVVVLGLTSGGPTYIGMVLVNDSIYLQQDVTAELVTKPLNISVGVG